MDKELLKRLEKKLLEERKRITADLKFFAKKDPKVKGNWKTLFPFFGRGVSEDEGDNAEEVEEYVSLLPVEHTLELRLKDINLALGKIKEGDYGQCEKCHKKIETKRLIVNPEARVCMDCGNEKK